MRTDGSEPLKLHINTVVVAKNSRHLLRTGKQTYFLASLLEALITSVAEGTPTRLNVIPWNQANKLQLKAFSALYNSTLPESGYLGPQLLLFEY